MGKIIPQNLEAESLDRPPQEYQEDLFFVLPGSDTNANATGIAPLYDDEIGLWEELEHRNRQNKTARNKQHAILNVTVQSTVRQIWFQVGSP